jgi:2-polyprenyl-3-methyl-5-hydroxy-6-metoxy-1,4-benzoquinol methylase
MENASKKINTSICLVCGHTSSVPYAEKNAYKVMKCSGCGTLFLDPLPDSEQVAKLYSQDYFGGATKGHGYVDYDVDKEAMRSVFVNHIKKFERILGQKGKLFDVGAATGFFIKIAHDHGWKAEGIDISEYASQIARSRGINVVKGTIYDANSVELYDIITMWDVIEHVPDPLSHLLKANSLMRRGGLIAINTPDSGSTFSRIMGKRWHLFVPPEHIWYFNQKSIEILLNKAGFEVIEIGRIGKKFTLEYVISFLYRWQKLEFWHKLSKKLEHTRIGKLSLPINLRDNMYVLARKK